MTTGNNIMDNDIITVNGVPWPKMIVEPRLYRFRSVIANVNRAHRFLVVALNTSEVTDGKFPTLEYAEAVIKDGGGHGSRSLNAKPDLDACQAEQFIMLSTDVEFLAYPVRSKVGRLAEIQYKVSTCVYASAVFLLFL